MKKIILLTLFIWLGAFAFAQKRVVCCSKPSATRQFAILASSSKFKMAHKNPLPVRFQSAVGTAITYKTADGKGATAYMLKAKKATNNYILVIHEWWGLNDYVKRESEKIYNDLGNVNVIALDLYDGKVAATREDAGKLMQAVNDDRAKAIINGAIAYAGPKAHIATIGWCFGGGWSLQTAIEGGKQAVGCIMYYGQPEKDVARLATINCDIIGFFGNQDKFPSPAVVDQFVKDADMAHVKLFVNRYEANHGFANPSNPSHNKEATDDAHAKAIAFIKERMK